MKIIGITGGTGSGKSTVSNILAGFDRVKVTDADKIAHEITVKGGEALKELVVRFSSVILNDKGELDRKALGDIVFGNPDNLADLNRIIHKYIIDEIVKEVQTTKKEGICNVMAIDAPVPVKRGFLDIVDKVWVVMADKCLRIERIMARDAMDYNSALKRIEAQLSDNAYLDIADEVIYNNGSNEELLKQVTGLYKKLLR